jgi:hypothetical protein
MVTLIAVENVGCDWQWAAVQLLQQQHPAQYLAIAAGAALEPAQTSMHAM